MRKFAWGTAVLLTFLVSGCDEDKPKNQVSANAPQPEAPKTETGKPEPNKPTEPAVLKQAKAATGTGVSPESDPGRVTFDGDKPRPDAPALPGAVMAAPGGSPEKHNAKANALYNAPSTVGALSITEPPPPNTPVQTKKKPFTIASADAARGLNAKEDGLRDAVADNAVKPQNGSRACTSGMSYIDGYCIDTYEAYLTEGGKTWPHYQKLDPIKVYKAASKFGAMPQAYISGDQASAACSASGKRLCSMKEWVKACKGPMKTQYPYGATYEPGACSEYDHKDHSGHRSAMHRLFGDNADYTGGPMNDPRIDQLPETVAPSGSFSKCTNDYGVYDMVGNVHEWVSDKAGSLGVFKGGYFEDTHINGDGCAYSTTRHGTGYHDYSTGFRCCADPS